jgi:branched-chain amino acid aminotransferase
MAAETRSPAFGSAFTPHMLVQKYADGKWSPAEIVPYGPFSFSPSAVVFHYGQEIFEGFKGYRQPDNSIALFRPDRNLARMNNSAKRLCMAAIDEKQVLADVVRLVKADAEHLPPRPMSLYIRPAMIATDTVIKVNPSAQYTFFVIACVVGDYFGGGDPRGVRLRTETEYVRAAPGGTGAAKCGGNYAASLAAQGQASKEGFDQVVWLDAREHKYIEEMGGMNIMFVINGALVTPSLDSGSILPGITRESLIALAKTQGRNVEERAISTDELIEAFKSGALSECFACGTAAVVTPIREILHRGQVLYRNESDKPGALTMQLRQQLVDIQYGTAPDPANWRYSVK